MDDKIDENEDLVNSQEDIDDLTGIVEHEISNKMELVNKNTHIHKRYHGKTVPSEDKEDSIGRISSADERDCELIFSGQF